MFRPLLKPGTRTADVVGVTPSPATSGELDAADQLTDQLTGQLTDLLDAPSGRRSGLRTVYQPIVDLASGTPVGFEALARGPAGSPLERPDALFGAARNAGRLAELDAACRRSALRGARDAGLRAPWTLFVNTEPATTRVDTLATPASGREARVVVEFTERALTRDPAELLLVVDRLRELGHGIAVDDVGVDPASLALLPLLRPNVVKLDMALVQGRPTPSVASVVAAVEAEAERSGALVLAEGIETPEQLSTARALGATLGQGWLFGRPGELPADLPLAPSAVLPLPSAATGAGAVSPFALASARREVRTAEKPLLIEISKHLERQAAASGESAVVVATFQHERHFTAETRRRYAALAEVVTFVGVLGQGLPPHPMPGVRGGMLLAADPLVHEWDIAVVSPLRRHAGRSRPRRRRPGRAAAIRPRAQLRP